MNTWLSNPLDFLTAVFSLNALVERDKGTEPLLTHSIPEEWIPQELAESYSVCKQHFTSALDEAKTLRLPEAKKQYLLDVLAALIAQCEEGEGIPLSYAQRMERFTGLPGEKITDSEIARLQEALSVDLARAGYTGSLKTALDAWRTNTSIDPAAFIDEATRLFDESLVLTRQHVVSLPEQAEISFEPVRDVYYRGYSHAAGPYKARITLNADLEWPLSSLKHVVSHEGCPGHFGVSASRRYQADCDLLAMEERFFFANTPVTAINEGTCNLGAYLLGWFDTFDDQICLRADMLRSALLLNMCFLFHEDGASEEDVVAYYKDNGAVTEASAIQTMKFVKHPLWHTSNPHYWHGTNRVFDAYHHCLREDRMGDLIQVLYKEIHTYRSLGTAVGLPF